MQTNGQSNGYHKPFPALTPAQRLHLDVYGYVIIENTLTANEVGATREALQKLKRDLIATGDPANAVVRGARFSTYKPHHVHFAHVLEADPAIFNYLTKPRLVAMAEEFVGGAVRLEESEAITDSGEERIWLFARIDRVANQFNRQWMLRRFVIDAHLVAPLLSASSTNPFLS